MFHRCYDEKPCYMEKIFIGVLRERLRTLNLHFKGGEVLKQWPKYPPQFIVKPKTMFLQSPVELFGINCLGGRENSKTACPKDSQPCLCLSKHNS